MKYDVFGIGNALMDMLVRVDDSLILEFDLKKGTMTLVDEDRINEIENNLSDITVSPGGSVSNTLAGIANLGGKVIFCGIVGKDKHGLVYEEKIKQEGIISRLRKEDGGTGRVIALITNDSERTFATHLGVAVKIRKNDVLEEDIKESKFLHLEGYLLDDPLLRETVFHSIELANKNKVSVSIDLGDPFLIKRNFFYIQKIIEKKPFIIFVNEEEAKALTGDEPLSALEKISHMAEIAVVKIGEKGSLVKSKGELFEISPFLVKAVDTTGAGDLYSAGFLYGLCRGYGLAKCGKIGSFMASRIVSKIGARLDVSLKKEVEKIIKS